MNLRRWLSRTPQPAVVRVDGQKLNLAQGRNQWSDAVKAIETLNPRRVEAMAADGSILRVLDWQKAADEPDEDEKPKAAPEDRDVQLARILVDAGDKGAARVVEAFRGGFDTLMTLVTVMAKRQTTLEAAYHRQIMKPPTMVIEGTTGEEKEDDLDQMAKVMMMQMMANAGQSGPPPGAATPPASGKH